jgi:hypothetical protein
MLRLLLGWLTVALWHLPYFGKEKRTKEKKCSLVGAAVAALKPREGL